MFIIPKALLAYNDKFCFIPYIVFETSRCYIPCSDIQNYFHRPFQKLFQTPGSLKLALKPYYPNDESNQ